MLIPEIHVAVRGSLKLTVGRWLPKAAVGSFKTTGTHNGICSPRPGRPSTYRRLINKDTRCASLKITTIELHLKLQVVFWGVFSSRGHRRHNKMNLVSLGTTRSLHRHTEA